MFGRPPHEFSAPPLVVEGGRVFAQTQLGTVACMDLFSGDVLWQTRYEQIAAASLSVAQVDPLGGGFAAAPTNTSCAAASSPRRRRH